MEQIEEKISEEENLQDQLEHKDQKIAMLEKKMKDRDSLIKKFEEDQQKLVKKFKDKNK